VTGERHNAATDKRFSRPINAARLYAKIYSNNRAYRVSLGMLLYLNRATRTIRYRASRNIPFDKTYLRRRVKKKGKKTAAQFLSLFARASYFENHQVPSLPPLLPFSRHYSRREDRDVRSRCLYYKMAKFLLGKLRAPRSCRFYICECMNNSRKISSKSNTCVLRQSQQWDIKHEPCELIK